jgi:hypothetical protein
LLFEAPVVDERQTHGAIREHARTPPEYRLSSCDRGDARRAEAEAFIRKRFLRSHGAHVAAFMPSLLLLTDAAGDIAAAAGIRGAARESLFLEQYLPVPIEQALSSEVSTAVPRAQILEIGNFAALDGRCARILMSVLPAYLLQKSTRWIVFTATTSIRRILSSMGGHCLELGTADGACLSGGIDEWGRYYSNDPRVMAGFLPSARRIPALWRPHGD